MYFVRFCTKNYLCCCFYPKINLLILYVFAPKIIFVAVSTTKLIFLLFDFLAVYGFKASECAKESVVEESQVQDLIDDGANVEDETAIEGPNLEVENISKEVSNDGTIELGSSLDAEEETLSPVSTRSNSPVMVNTVEELKKVLVRDDKFEFVVNVEVQKTEEFQKFMAEKIQKNSEIADSKDGDRENRKAHGLKEAKKARVGQARFTRSSAKLMSFEKEENPEELKSKVIRFN